MTKRFFYTDPLAAAWMAKHFGMTFEFWHREYSYRPDDLEYVVARFMRDGRVERPVYVHPDSLHLLEPQIGDQGIDANECQCRYLDDYDPEGAWFIDGVPVTSFDRATLPVSIDKRNGIAFMFPESEDA